MTFEKLLEKLEPNRKLWVFSSIIIDKQKLIKNIQLCRQSIVFHKTAKVALEVADYEKAMTWALALDGLVGKVFLVSNYLRRSDDYPQLIETFDPDFIIDDTTAIGCTVNNKRESDNSIASPEIITLWCLATSGTTGTPKIIEHTSASLTRTCKLDAERGKDYVWGLVYDPFRFAGFQVVLQSLASGSQLVFASDSQSITEQVSFFRSQSVNALSATPTYWRKLLMSGECKGLNLKQVTLGGETADQSVLNALTKVFPNARITHIYASTEAGVGFSVKDGKAGFPYEFLTQGVAGNLLAVSSSGTLMIKSQKNSFKNDFIDTGDLVELRNKRVYFLGRDSGAINVGGNKVIPEEVEAVIREVEGVAEVIVKPKKSGVMGELVTAEIQTATKEADTRILKQTIVKHCQSKLEKFKIPVFIKFVDEIDLNNTGKLSRK